MNGRILTLLGTMLPLMALQIKSILKQVLIAAFNLAMTFISMVCFIVLFYSYFLSHFLEPYHPLKLYHANLDGTNDFNMYLFFFRERDFGADDTTPVSIVDLREREEIE